MYRLTFLLAGTLLFVYPAHAEDDAAPPAEAAAAEAAPESGTAAEETAPAAKEAVPAADEKTAPEAAMTEEPAAEEEAAPAADEAAPAADEEAAPEAAKTEEPAAETWKSAKGGIELDYPADWGPAKDVPGGGIQLFKAGEGWLELSLIDLPDDTGLADFADIIRMKTERKDSDLALIEDQGVQEIDGKKCFVHKYEHKTKKDRVYYGYHFLPEGSGIGVRILMVRLSEPGGEAMMDMIRSLRTPAPKKPAAADAGAEKPFILVSKGKVAGSDMSALKPIDEEQAPAETEGEQAQAAEPEAAAEKSLPLPWEQKITEFGEYNKKGLFRGKVMVADKLKRKSTLPVYLAFFPLEQVSGASKSKSLSDFKPSGAPLYTVTDETGYYRIDLPEGDFYPVLYNRGGEHWKLLSGEGVLHRTRSRRFQHFRVDNR